MLAAIERFKSDKDREINRLAHITGPDVTAQPEEVAAAATVSPSRADIVALRQVANTAAQLALADALRKMGSRRCPLDSAWLAGYASCCWPV